MKVTRQEKLMVANVRDGGDAKVCVLGGRIEPRVDIAELLRDVLIDEAARQTKLWHDWWDWKAAAFPHWDEGHAGAIVLLKRGNRITANASSQGMLVPKKLGWRLLQRAYRLGRQYNRKGGRPEPRW